jgi:outer membrane protein OmpA-like peptidoglycan-associated protein
MLFPPLLAAAALAQAPAPLVLFFDSSGAEIRREWQPVLEAAAERARSGQRLLVVGHSDTSGSAAANRRVAAKRAQAVADALIALGVPAQALTTASAGEEQLLVPTAEGVREIQNRRVVITAAP